MFCVVLRSSQERTAAKSEALLRDQFDCVNVVEGIKPLAAAVQRSFEIALASGKSWLIVVDADMLIMPNFRQMIEAHANDPHTGWQVAAMCDDKLYDGVRRGSPRLIRTSVIPDLVVCGEAIRPEAKLFHEREGAKSTQEVWCTHDYDQYYSDLHRKGAHSRIKHPRWGDWLVPKWRESADLDLRAAAAGWDNEPITWPEKGAL